MRRKRKKEKSMDEVEGAQWWEVLPSLQSSKQESVANSGRLFLRNLSYTITKEDVVQLFEKSCPLTEVMILLDKTTNRPTGLSFVTFMLPEHTVKPFDDLDEQIFHGRLLHFCVLVPAQLKRM